MRAMSRSFNGQTVRIYISPRDTRVLMITIIEEQRLDEDDLAYVPLVTGVDGVVLRRVANCVTWSGYKEFQRRLKEQIDARKAAEGGDSDVAPSEKSHSKAQSGHKRKALDDEVDSSDIEEIAAPVPVKKTKKCRVRSPSPLPTSAKPAGSGIVWHVLV